MLGKFISGVKSGLSLALVRKITPFPEKQFANRVLMNVFYHQAANIGSCLVDHGPVSGRFAAKGVVILMKRKRKHAALQNH